MLLAFVPLYLAAEAPSIPTIEFRGFQLPVACPTSLQEAEQIRQLFIRQSLFIPASGDSAVRNQINVRLLDLIRYFSRCAKTGPREKFWEIPTPFTGSRRDQDQFLACSARGIELSRFGGRQTA
jgi:hypothetical protein